jgi:hypothetical protein
LFDVVLSHSALVAWVGIHRGVRRQQDALALASKARRDRAQAEGWRVLQAHVLHKVRQRAANARAVRRWRRRVLETVWAALVQGSQAGTQHLGEAMDHHERRQATKALRYYAVYGKLATALGSHSLTFNYDWLWQYLARACRTAASASRHEGAGRGACAFQDHAHTLDQVRRPVRASSTMDVLYLLGVYT